MKKSSSLSLVTKFPLLCNIEFYVCLSLYNNQQYLYIIKETHLLWDNPILRVLLLILTCIFVFTAFIECKFMPLPSVSNQYRVLFILFSYIFLFDLY